MLRIFFAFLMLISNSTFADSSEGSEQLFGNWSSLIINGKFGKDSSWIYYGDVAIRSSENHKDKNGDSAGYDIGAVPVRFGVGYQFDKMNFEKMTSTNSLLVGYLFQYSAPPYSKFSIYENRTWEQYLNVLDFGEWGKLQNRSRFEQRTVTYMEGTSLRWRQAIKYTYPINKDWGMSIAEEFFANMNTVGFGPTAGFDQNRVFVGPTYKINEETKLEFGYMNNYVNKDFKSDLDNHVLVLNFYYNVPD